MIDEIIHKKKSWDLLQHQSVDYTTSTARQFGEFLEVLFPAYGALLLTYN
jgi:hypothetical protein